VFTQSFRSSLDEIRLNPFSNFIFLGATQQHDSLEMGVAKLEHTVEGLNMRMARLLGEYASSQAKLKKRLSKLEER
jgi:cyclic nucleotide gated channel alpha 3